MTGKSSTIQQRLSPCLEWIFAGPEDISERIGEAAKDGMKQVEFWFWRRRDVSRMADALKAHGVGVSAMVVDPQADIADGNTHKEWLANVQDSAKVAAYLGSPVLVATAGQRLVDGPPDAEQLDVAAEALRAAATIAAEQGVVVALEPLNERVDHPGTLLTSSLTALELVQHVDSPALGILLDIYHSHAMGEDVAAVVSDLGRHIAHVQVADDPGRHEPGTGQIPWRDALMALDKAGYAGSFGLEYKPTMPSAASVEFTTNVLSEAGKPKTD